MDALQVLREILAAVLHVDPREVVVSTGLESDLCTDSLDMYMIIERVETAFAIKFCESEFRSLRTVGDILNLIEEKRGR